MQGQDRRGQKLGNYKLIQLLGKGGYSEVYLAENIYLDVKTAIKVLKGRDLDNLEQEKFRSEAKFMTTLEHPRIIKVLDYGIEMSQQNDESTPYIVMEYAQLGTLRTLYRRGTRMPLAKVALYTMQIAEALQYAHDKNIIHQDVKPENMLVRKEDDVALSDFGIAVADLNTSNLQLQQAAILQKNARGEQISIVGTTPYLAPERLQGHIQRASDQYSLAIVVYEWLAGKRPFEGSVVEVCHKHQKEPPPSLTATYPYISRDVESVVMKALSKAPSDRYKSVRDFALALDNAIRASQPALRPDLSSFSSSIPVVDVANMPPSRPPTQASMLPPNSPPASPASPAPFAYPQQSTPGGQPAMFSPGNIPPFNAAPLPGPVPQGLSARNSFSTAPGPDQQGSLPPHAGSISWQQQQSFDYTDYVDPTVANGLASGGRQSPPRTREFSEMLADFFERPATTTRKMFVSDKYFLQKPGSRMFYLIGIAANILSALVVFVVGGILAHSFLLSLVPAVIGGTLSIIMLWRCSVSVKQPIAIAFGIGVALWWGIAAILITPPDKPAFAFLGFLLAVLISTAIHVWYVNTRLRQ